MLDADEQRIVHEVVGAQPLDVPQQLRDDEGSVVLGHAERPVDLVVAQNDAGGGGLGRGRGRGRGRGKRRGGRGGRIVEGEGGGLV